MGQMLNEFRTSGCYNVDTSILTPLRLYFCNTSSETFYVSCYNDGLVPARLRTCMLAILFLFLSRVILVMLNKNLRNAGKYLPNGIVENLNVRPTYTGRFIMSSVITNIYNKKTMLTRVWQELEYRIDVCRVTRGAHIEHL